MSSIGVGKFGIFDELAVGEACQKLQQIDALWLRQNEGTHTAVLQRIFVTTPYIVVQHRVEGGRGAPDR